MLNLTTKSTYYFVDSYGMMLRQDLNGTGELGERDSIGRTFEAYWVYGNIGFFEAIALCGDPVFIGKGYQYYLIFYRHPEFLKRPDIINDCSRDHVLYYIMANRMAGYDESKNVRWKISDTAHLDLSSYAYLRKKWWLYYSVNILIHLFFNLYQPVIIFISKLLNNKQNETRH
jgi:hypothetical protein